MFVQIFRNETVFIIVNVNNILFFEPAASGVGTRVVLVNGTDFHSSEKYESILNNIQNLT